MTTDSPTIKQIAEDYGRRVGNLWHFDDLALSIFAAKVRGIPSDKPAFYGFMDEENCCVHLCFTPHHPGGKNNTLPTAYYTSSQKE